MDKCAARRVTESADVWVMDGAMIDKTKHDDLGDCGLAGKRKEVRIGNVNKTGLDDAGPVLTFGEMADGHLTRMVDGKDLRPIPFSGVDISQPDEVEKTRRRRRGCATE